MLVRMTWKGEPKFIRPDGALRIAKDGDGDTRVDYEADEFDFVDGTPDEVFKALFNPPEMIEKEKVAKFLDAIDNVLADAQDGRRHIDFSNFLREARKSLGVPRVRR